MALIYAVPALFYHLLNSQDWYMPLVDGLFDGKKMFLIL